MSDQEAKRVPYFPMSLLIFNDLSRLEVSVSAWVALDYIIRHTKGWKGNRWVTLRIQDFINGRPTPGGDKYDHGIPIKHPATVYAALEELGIKGFILELDEGHKDGRYTFALQDRYFTDDAEQAAKLQTTSKYRYIRKVDGKYYPKDKKDQEPHYYGVMVARPLQKSKTSTKKGKRSSKIEDSSSIIEEGLQSLKSSPSNIEEQEEPRAVPQLAPEPADIKGTESKITDNRTDSSVANATGAPSSRREDDDIKQEDEDTALKRRLLLAERAKWEGITERDANWGEARREMRRLNRLLEELEG